MPVLLEEPGHLLAGPRWFEKEEAESKSALSLEILQIVKHASMQSLPKSDLEAPAGL